MPIDTPYKLDDYRARSNILPSLIGGEERIRQTSEDAIAAAPLEALRMALATQRAKEHPVIVSKRRMKLAAA